MHESPKFPFLARVVKRVWLQVVVLAALVSGHVLLEFLPETKRHPAYPKAIAFFAVWVGAWIAARVVGVFREAPFVESRLAPNLRPLVFLFARILVYSLAFLIALDSIGVSITPLLASLGVGSLAVGLALQDTLGNLFSGFYLYLDRPIAIGDWIRLENGTEGMVVAIGWRSTHIQVGAEDRVIVPNSKLSTSIVVNYNLPMPGTALTLPLGVAYESDLERVESTLVECVNRVGSELKGLLEAGSEPIVRFTKFGESSIELALTVRVRSFPDTAIVRHALIKDIRSAFARSNIEIPYPKRVVRQETSSDTAH